MILGVPFIARLRNRYRLINWRIHSLCGFGSITETETHTSNRLMGTFLRTFIYNTSTSFRLMEQDGVVFLLASILEILGSNLDQNTGYAIWHSFVIHLSLSRWMITIANSLQILTYTPTVTLLCNSVLHNLCSSNSIIKWLKYQSPCISRLGSSAFNADITAKLILPSSL